MRWLLCLLLAGCVIDCPANYVLVKIDGLPNCVSELSFCLADNDCTGVRYNCSDACKYYPVNNAHSDIAHEKSQSCAVTCFDNVFVEPYCSKYQCALNITNVTKLVSSLELIEVKRGSAACYSIVGANISIRIGVRNPSWKNLTDISTIVYGDKQTGLPFFPQTFKKFKPLMVQLGVNESRVISGEYERVGVGLPRRVSLRPVQRIVLRYRDFGLVEGEEVIISPVPNCNG